MSVLVVKEAIGQLVIGVVGEPDVVLVATQEKATLVVGAEQGPGGPEGIPGPPGADGQASIPAVIDGGAF